MNALDALFRDEVDRQAGPLRDGLKRCRVEPPDGETIFCAQALKGAARVVGMPATEQLADALELLLSAGELAGTVLQPEQVLAAEEALELIEAVAQAGADLADEVANTMQVQGVLGRLASAAKRGPSRAKSTQRAIPRATLELFAAECEQQAATLTKGLLELESQPQGKMVIEPLMRAAHSVKGAARVVGFDAAVALAHAMEDQFDRALKGMLVLGPDMIDGLLAACDLFQRIGAVTLKADAGAALPDSSLLEAAEHITQLGAAGLAKSDAVLARSAQTLGLEITAEDSDRPTLRADEPPAEPEAGPVFPAAGTKGGFVEARGGDQRVLRVRAGQISRILGLAGESIVEADRLRELGTLLASIRAGQAALADMLDELASQPGAMHRNSAVGRGLVALRLQLQDLRLASSEWFEAFAGHARRSEQLGAGLFREASDTRMRPLGDGLASFPRLVRDLTRRLGKQAELTIDGEAIRIDRDILERIEAPLNHLLRNALDHGIEPAALRVAAGKPERAALGIRARVMGGFIHLEVSDDGAGIDTDKVRTRIAEMALASAEAVSAMDDDLLFDFLFVSGFTTATRVTEISGRGVGLAVVRSVMRDIGGAVHIRSQRGQGSCFTLQVPVSRSVLRSVIVSIGGEPYAFGLSSVSRVLRVGRDQVRTVNGQRYLTQGDQTLALVDAASALGLAAATLDADLLQVVVVSARPHDFGFVVEAVRGQHDLVLQPLDSRLGRIPDVSAAAILPDGQPVVVLDADDLCRSVLRSSAGTDGFRTSSPVTALPQRRRILVVDDSPTVRETQRDALARNGYDVATAADGMEAWHMLRAGAFDLLVSDVDMPRLDGIGLVRSVRQEQRLRTLPVVMVSYRGSAEDRETALAAGADVYLLKANFDDQQLYDAVMRLIGGPERP